jgi:hypothetical protein
VAETPGKVHAVTAYMDHLGGALSVLSIEWLYFSVIYNAWIYR